MVLAARPLLLLLLPLLPLLLLLFGEHGAEQPGVVVSVDGIGAVVLYQLEDLREGGVVVDEVAPSVTILLQPVVHQLLAVAVVEGRGERRFNSNS